MIVHVKKNEVGEVVAVFANPQSDALDADGNVVCAGVPTEPMSDDALEVVEFLTRQASLLGAITCTPWQIRKALNALGLRQSVEDAIAASTDQNLKDGWQFATEFRSDDHFVISMGAALGKTEAETAELIQYAGTL
jgi:D-arabinose 1-dehydrogenase-like Zn-dependent alcohol dehydrogenase